MMLDTLQKKVSDLTNYYDKTTVDEKIDAIPKPDLTNYLTKTGDGSNLTAAFEEATTLEELTTGEKLSSIFGKIKLALKNLKSLISLIGTTDISTIGDGTITGGLSDVNGKLVNIIRYTTIKGNTDGNGIIYIGQQAPDGAMPILVQIGDSTKWLECTILSKSIDNAQHFAARIRNADGSAYASIKNMVIGVLWGV